MKPYRRERPKPLPPTPERNAPCACGSGRKFKKCCDLVDHERARQQMLAYRAEHERWLREVQTDPSRRPRKMSPATMVVLAAAGMGVTGRR